MYRGLPGQPSPGPIRRVIGAVVAVAVLALAATLGVVVLAVLLGLAAIGAVILAVRIWWFRRQLRQAAQHFEEEEGRREHGKGPSGGRVIEGEYTRQDEKKRKDR